MADLTRKTANLFDGLLIGGYFTAASFTTSGDENVFKSIKVYLSAGTYTFSWGRNVNVVRLIIDGNYSVAGGTNISLYTITSTTDGYVGISFRDTTSGTTAWDNTTPIMLNTGSTAKPYEPYGWVHSLRKLTTASETIQSGDTIYADGTAITAYTIKGNTVQSGTPTPSAPLPVNGVGNKTANLFDETYPNIDSSLHYSAIYVGDGQFTMSTSCPRNQSGACLFFLAGNVSSGASTESNGVWGYSGTAYGTMTRTQTAVNGYVTIAYRSLTTELNPVNEDTMVNSGSTAQSYEPYGYFIEIEVS